MRSNMKYSLVKRSEPGNRFPALPPQPWIATTAGPLPDRVAGINQPKTVFPFFSEDGDILILQTDIGGRTSFDYPFRSPDYDG